MFSTEGVMSRVDLGAQAAETATNESNGRVKLLKIDIQEAEKALLDNMTPTLGQRIMHAGAIALAALKVLFTGFSDKALENLKHTWRSTPVSEKAAEKVMEAVQKLKTYSDNEVNFRPAIECICEDEIEQSNNPELSIQSTSKDSRTEERTNALIYLANSTLTAAELTRSDNNSIANVREFQEQLKKLTPARR